MESTSTSADRRVSYIHYGPDTSGCRLECVSELIRKRAYELFETRGHQPGHELDDWLRAEREIKHHLNI